MSAHLETAFSVYAKCISLDLKDIDGTQATLKDLLAKSLAEEKKKMQAMMSIGGGSSASGSGSATKKSPEKKGRNSLGTKNEGLALSAMSMPRGWGVAGAAVAPKTEGGGASDRGFLFHPGAAAGGGKEEGGGSEKKKKSKRKRSLSVGSDVVIGGPDGNIESFIDDTKAESSAMHTNDDSDADSLLDEPAQVVTGRRKRVNKNAEAMQDLVEAPKIFQKGDEVDFEAIAANFTKRIKPGVIDRVNEDGTYNVKGLNDGRIIENVEKESIEHAEDDLDLR